MTTRRFSVAALAGLAAVSLTLAGCSTSGDAPADSADEDIELSMLVNITPNLTEEFWNELVAPFEKANPNIDVVIDNPGQEGVSAAEQGHQDARPHEDGHVVRHDGGDHRGGRERHDPDDRECESLGDGVASGPRGRPRGGKSVEKAAGG